MSSYFVNYFEHDRVTNFVDLAETASGADHYVAGSFYQDALFSKIDATGKGLWTRRYMLKGKKLSFGSVVEMDGGDFLLHGSEKIDSNHNKNLVVRVRPDGTVVWSKTYTADNTRYNRRMVKSGVDSYFMASWYNVSGSSDDIEIVKINGNGTVLGTVRIGGKYDEQVNSIVPYADGLIVFGGTSEGHRWDAWIMRLDKNLKVVWQHMVGDAYFQEIREVIPLGKEKFAVLTETSKDRHTSFFIFDPAQQTFALKSYDLVPEREHGHKRMIRAGSFYYLVGEEASSEYSFVTKLDLKFNIIWHKRLDTGAKYRLRDVQYHPQDPNVLRFCGYVTLKSTDGFLLKTDLDFTTCITKPLEIPEAQPLTFKLKGWKPPIGVINPKVEPVELQVITYIPEVVELCDTPDLTLQSGYFQSPYIYLQAAGSTAIDNSVFGYHLRWTFRRNLGETHLAKGDLSGPTGPYATNIGYNRSDDYVRIYQLEFRESFARTIDFSISPSSVVESGAVRRWTYLGSVIGNDPTNVILTFTNLTLYDQVRANINPALNSGGFIAAYAGVIEVSIQDKRFFYAKFRMGTDLSVPPNSGELRVETIALPDPLEPNDVQLTCRKKFPGMGTSSQPIIICEDIATLRFDYTNAFPTHITLIAYADYIQGTANQNPSPWNFKGQYSLTLNDSIAFGELEDTTRFVVHNAWRKFNEPGTGQFRVNVQNYQARWSLPVDGLKAGVQSFLQLSQTDLSATAVLPNQDPVTNDSAMEVSYLDLLNMVSLDYHVARMLGLGTIDPRPKEYSTGRLNCYLMEYVTEASLEGEVPAPVRHFYMTPPTSVADHRLPPEPQIDLSFGLYADNKTGNPTLLTDINGYLPFGDVRYINVDKDPFRYELPNETFFQTNELFCMCDETLPLAFGIEYAPGSIATGNPFVRPELSNDSDYQDPGGLNEVIPLAETGQNPIYVHQSTDQGKNHYALYSINWFSRVSEISNKIEVDNVFPLRCPLMPPLNLHCHLIQPESTLIMTTGEEQMMLAALSGDKTLVRCTFEWNQVHNQAYQFADKVEVNFRTSDPLVVKGAIGTGALDLIVNSITHEVTVKTTSYNILSSATPQVVQPNITAANKPRFIGSTFVADGENFVIEDIITSASGDDPTFVLRQIRVTHSQEVPANSNIWCTTETWESPSLDDRFFIYENLDNNTFWDQVLTKKITTPHFTPTHTEVVTYNDGTSEVKQIGGLTDTSTIQHVFDPAPTAPPNTPTGVYEIRFDTKQLAAHPDADVSYYQGSLRVMGASGDMKVLPVWKIDRVNFSTLRITVYDATYLADEVIPSGFALVNGVTVNFHPGIRAYFKVNANFDEGHTLPGFGEGTRMTYMAARSLDTSNGCTSYLTVPVILLAQEIRTPVPPGIPSGPVFATRPNFYGKATYTFDVEVDQPYSLIFYRANERKILDELYDSTTVATILSDLAALPAADAAFAQDRWNDLANMNLDGSNLFKEYISGGYRFPMPNNPKYVIPHPDVNVQETPLDDGLNFNNTFTYFDPVIGMNVVTSMIDIVKNAIDGAFLPLTEIPCVYGQLQDDLFQTSGRPPTLRDSNGERLLPTDNDFDPWPMTFRFEKNGGGTILQDGDSGYGNASNTRLVRFTDYTLDGAAQNFYFYFGVELSATLEVSDRSPVKGPISLVNSEPAEQPQIKKLETVLSVGPLKTGPGVRFILNNFVESQDIVRHDIYRTTSSQAALSVRTMKLAKTVNVGEDLMDDFSDVSIPLYGDPLFYRLVAFRKILNEQGIVEFVPSKASNLSLTNIVDNVLPPAPTLVVTYGTPTGVPLELPAVSFTWDKTAHNATYYLYKQNVSGTWVKIYEIGPAVHLNTSTMGVALSGTSLLVPDLLREDDDGNTIYHRFRVDVENSSGLINVVKGEITV